MTTHNHDEGPNRRKVLECMTWAGTGVLVDRRRRSANFARHHR